MSQTDIQELENTNFKEKLSIVISELEKKFIERDEILRLIILTIFSKHHIFLIGPPGVGKTYLLKIILSMVEDGKMWEIQMTKDTKEKALFGDDETPIEDTMLNGSQFFFFDEMFKATDDLLVATLSIWNERYFTKGGRSIEVPVYSLFAASNEISMSEKIEPFVDRLLIWYEIPRIQKSENFLRFMRGEFDKNPQLSWKFNLSTIDYVSARASSEVKFNKESEMAFLAIKTNLISDKIDVSDRKLGEKFIISALKVSAFLNNRKEIDYSDLFLMIHMVWSNKELKFKARETIMTTIFKTKNEVNKYISDYSDHYDSHESLLQRDFGTFLSYTSELSGSNKNNDFKEVRNHISNYLISMQAEYDNMLEIKKHYDFVMYVEKQIDDNIFVINVHNKVFDNKNTEELFKFIGTKEMELNRLKEWLEKNKSYFYYEENRCKIGGMC